MEFKAPTVPKTFSIDWSVWLPTGVTITSATNTLDDELTEDATSHNDTVVNVKISAGVAGKVYECVSHIVDSDSVPYDQVWYLNVQKQIN